MKKGLIISILVIAGILVAGGLVINAILEIAEAIVGFVIFLVVILAGFGIFKIRLCYFENPSNYPKQCASGFRVNFDGG